MLVVDGSLGPPLFAILADDPCPVLPPLFPSIPLQLHARRLVNSHGGGGLEWLMAAWALHYLPFWAMTRVLYFHHYFPAFLYSCMLAGVVVDYVIKLVCLVAPPSLSVTLFHIAVGLVLSATSYSFYLFHPLTFGMGPGSSQEEGHIMHGLRWLDSWEF
ncbi:POMT2-like protein [Mya arenaria]|uniref:POMT2-like protein n=1 Tax=Mya arenaria TaxID=6604 RepID=A0ABY7FEV5_MYAAR|nr:POMT2-like protein [Mya arenaria]